MKRFFYFAPLALLAGAAHADPAPLKVTSEAFSDGGAIPSRFAYCRPDGAGKSQKSSNISPDITWSGAPEGTKSYAIVVIDPDVPASFDDANQEGKTISAAAGRQDFTHWALVNIPTTVTNLPEGAGKGIADVTGKRNFMGWPALNDYASFMKDQPKTNFYGYDGPCPPWNDERVHHYHFTVYALDVEKPIYLSTFNGKNALEAIEKHTIAKGEIVGTYSNLIK